MLSSQDLGSLENHFSVDTKGGPSQISSSSTFSPHSGSTYNHTTLIKSLNDTAPEKSLPATKVSWRFLAAFSCLCVVNLVCAIDATILSVALPTIAADLDGTAIEAFWAGTSFLLTSAVFQPTWASLSHIFGRKSVLLVALGLFSAGSIIAAVARNITDLLVGRSVQGIGVGGLQVLTYVIVTDMVSLRERGKWFAFISLMWAVGSVIGPVIGGIFAENANWRWIFWLNIPFCIIAFVGIPIFLRLNQKIGSIFEKLKAVDWVGSFLFVSSLTCFLIPLTWGGIQFEWYSWHTLLPMILGVVGLLGFLAYSKFVAREPLICGSIFTTSTAIVGYLGTFIHGIIVWSLLYYMPLYSEVAKDCDPVKAGIALFPLTFTTTPAAVITGLIITKTGKYMPLIWLSWIMTTIGMGVLTILQQSTSVPVWIILCLVSGIGLGILYSSQSFAVQAAASTADIPQAAAMYSFFRSLGQTFGVAVGGVIFQNTLEHNLLESVDPLLSSHAGAWATDASALVEVIKAMPVSGARDELVAVYVDSLRIVWIVMCALAGVVLLLSLLFMKEMGLDRPHETDQAFVHDIKISDEELNPIFSSSSTPVNTRELF